MKSVDIPLLACMLMAVVLHPASCATDLVCCRGGIAAVLPMVVNFLPVHMHSRAAMTVKCAFVVPCGQLPRSMPQVHARASRGFGGPGTSAKRKKGKKKPEYMVQKLVCPCGSGLKYPVRQA